MDERIKLLVPLIQQEIDENLTTLKKFKEVWQKSDQRHPNEESINIYEYADRSFSRYSFMIEREKAAGIRMLRNILIQVFHAYNIEALWPNEEVIETDIPFDFILIIDGKRIGCRFSEYYSDMDFDQLRKEYNINELWEILLYRPGVADQIIERDASNTNGISKMNLKSFLDNYVSPELYSILMLNIDDYLKQTKRIIGYKTVSYLSAPNLSFFKEATRNKIEKYSYKDKHYSIIDKEKLYKNKCGYIVKELQKYTKDPDELKLIHENYIAKKRYMVMVGLSDFSKSFITSEWLFQSFEGNGYFDYTAIISGYLKSIEQLLCVIVKTFANGSLLYPKKAGVKRIDATLTTSYGKPVDCIYLTKGAIDGGEIDDTMGGLLLFFELNRQLFCVKDDTISAILKMIDCYKVECRNGHFHKHNLYNWDIVKTTRDNVWLLYFYILGAINIDIQNSLFQLASTDDFDKLCIKIREVRHYSYNFEFEYQDGRREKVVYDGVNNAPEYTIEGTEHYDNLNFIPVEDFEWSTMEKLNQYAEEGRSIKLTRTTMPKEIRCIMKDEIRKL